MMNLIIDGKPANIPADLEFSLKLDNPYFTKSSSHSLEVELPAVQNQHIFGIVNRMDSTVSKDMLPCELICNGIIMLQGKAGILEVTDKAVKVQLVSGISEFNFANRKDIFLDETNWEIPHKDNTKGYEHLAVYHDNKQMIFPFYYNDATSGEDIFKHAQVYLWKVLEVVVGHFGFKIGNSILHNTWLKHIICIGAYIKPALIWGDYKIWDEWRALPHWTVKDFLTEVEKLTGSVIYIDEKSRKVNVIGLNDYCTGKIIQLDDIVDEYECNIQEEEDKENHTVGNMSYQLPPENDDGYARLKKEVLASAETKKFNSFAELKTAWDTDDVTTKNKNLYIAEERHYITRDGKLTEVDIMGDLIRDLCDEKTHTSLKIVPIKLEERDVSIYERLPGGENRHIGQIRLLLPTVSMIASPATAVINNLQDVIEGREKIEQAKEKDIMEVAICTKQQYNMSGTNIKCISLFNDYKVKPMSQSDENMEMSLCLRNVCKDSIGRIHNTISKIESDVTYNVAFLYKGLPDVRDIFMIRNQKYIAKTITVRINTHGFEPIMEGEFYKI